MDEELESTAILMNYSVSLYGPGIKNTMYLTMEFPFMEFL